MANSKCRWESPEQWSDWSEWLAVGLHGRNRWRLPLLLTGILFAGGRRTVTSWLRAAGTADGFQDFFYFLAAVGRKTNSIATQLVLLLLRTLPLPGRLLLVIDDSPTKRYGPKVEGADVHHNPTPGPADQPFLYGHVWVTISLALRHSQWGAIGLPLRAMLYVRKRTMATIPKSRRWYRFATKLQLAARLVEWIVPMLKEAGKTVWIVVDGGYTKRPFLRRVLKLSRVVVVGRLRKDAALRDLPPPRKRGQRPARGRPRKYGKNKISLAKRAGHKQGWQTIACTVYGQTTTKTYKTFLATYAPVGCVIRVVLVKETHGWYAFFCTDPDASVKEIIEAFADRATIEQDFHDVKEVWGSGQQQVRNIWTNLAVYNLNLWMHTLVELWAWDKSGRQLVDRGDSPWDDPLRRPSHANRRKALRRQILRNELSTITAAWSLPRKIIQLTKNLVALAT
ncbi:MAG: transposase [Gemmatimonadales bacterium]|nr:transposase [Gemmatimonadales bacterium]